MSAGVLTLELAGERVDLLRERAMFWPHGSTLFVADVHLGKAAAFRAGGVPLPRGSTQADLARLGQAIARTGAQRLVVLGDFLHARAGRVPALESAFGAWRIRHRELAITLLRGNHDEAAGDPPPEWRVDVADEPSPLPPFLLCHEPGPRAGGYALCGHLHPGVRLSGRDGDSARLPCFVLDDDHAILPAFGSFTGLALVPHGAGRRIVAVAGARLFPLPAHS